MSNSSSFNQRIIGTALLSASALFLEITLTRLFSVLYFPPYVFFIISFAILGIGIGAAITALKASLREEKYLILYSSGASLFTLVLLIFTVVTASIDLQVILFALLIFPFIFVGLALSTVFSLYGESSRILYMGDLIGAGLGALLVVPVLNTFGVINGILIASVGFAISGIYFYTQRYMPLLVGVMILALVAFGSNFAINWLNIDMASIATDKPITNILGAGGTLIETSWDAFARTDLVDPDNGDPLRIYVDGGAASIMPSAGPNPQLVQDIGFFPFATEQPQRVFIIGPGAGLDVWFALQSNATEVVAVEVNPASVAMVERLSALNGGLYRQPIVEVITDDGRSVLQRSDEQFDLIYLSQVVTLAAERGGYALSENTIYTVEAFDEYLSKLSDNGQIALKLYDEITLTRALSTAMVALRNQGVSDAEALDHIMIMLDNNSSPPIPLMTIRKSAFSEDDSLVLGAIARDVGFTPVLLPHVLVQSPLDTIANGSESFDEIVNTSESNISAPTDDQPYFFQFEYGIPQTLVPLTILSFIISIIGIALFLIHWSRSSKQIVRLMPAYFAMLGIGFITIEIYIIQQTRLFLGHPTFAITLVLVTFLVGGGIGSGLSQRFGKRIQATNPFLIPVSVVGLFVMWLIVWSIISPQFTTSSLLIRGVLVTITLFPLTLIMGIPFSFGLNLVDKIDNRQVAVAWAVNGITTVIGTVLAVILSITNGFNMVSLLGIAAYVIATSVLLTLRRSEGA